MSRPGRLSGRLLRAGLALVVVGALMLGYVGWQDWGTTWVGRREQSRVDGAVGRVWAAHGSTVSERDRSLAQGVVALVRIPALGSSYLVPARRGTDEDVLADGFGIFPGSPAPGRTGNFALAGHRVTHGQPLRDMPRLRAGDRVVVQTRAGTFTYVLDTGGADLTVGSDADWVVDPDPDDPTTGVDAASITGSRRLLTLVTCADLFHSDRRLVAFGHLVTSSTKAGRGS